MEELLGRRVPWSAEAEQAVLGSCLIDPSCLPDVMTAVRGADFYLPQNREIFETIFSMFTFAKPIDPVTVLDEMKVRGVYHDESSQQYIRELMRLTPTAANVLKYAAIVRDQALLRNVITVCEETVEAASSGAGEAGDVLDLCEKKIYALRQDRVVGGLMPVSQADFVGKKTAFALEQGFSVILCIGETLAERKAGKLNSILWLQLERGLAGLGPNADYSRLAVAYEPVWAIGTGQTASDEDIRMVHTLVRELLSSLLGSNGIGIQILYGGSVKPDNAKAILSLDNVDGLLVGGASLQAQSFADIVRADLA